MKRFSKFLFSTIGLSIFIVASSTCLWADSYPDPYTYLPRVKEINKQKKYFDDPRPVLKNFGPSKVIPKEFNDYLEHDIEEMKTLWSETVGFKAPEVVNQIAPEVKPGKYTWQEVKNNPGIQKLLPEEYKSRIRAAGPPLFGAMPEIEIIPTRQYYWSIPLAEATKRNVGKTKLDDGGYLVEETYDSGFPFPRADGKHKAQQMLYNRVFYYPDYGGNWWGYDHIFGFDKKLKRDIDMSWTASSQRRSGRVMFEPYGYINDRAKKRGELTGTLLNYHSPRDISGMAWQSYVFKSTDKNNQDMIYYPYMRRIRKLSSSDTQDTMAGLSTTYDDVVVFNKKMTPDSYVAEYRVIEEREYLIPAPTETGDIYVDSNTKALMNVKFERRPLVVIEVKELDPNYVYSKRIVYIDKEHLNVVLGEYFDQKGRKWRSMISNYGWIPEYGMFTYAGSFWNYTDYIDFHSEIDFSYYLPAVWPDGTISLKGMLKKAK